MTTLDLKNTVKEYVETADTQLLEMIKDLVENYASQNDSLITDDQYKIVDDRRNKFQNGETKTLDWQKVKEKILNSSGK